MYTYTCGYKLLSTNMQLPCSSSKQLLCSKYATNTFHTSIYTCECTCRHVYLCVYVCMYTYNGDYACMYVFTDEYVSMLAYKDKYPWMYAYTDEWWENRQVKDKNIPHE
jgi:hypothetical protein